MEAQTMVHHEDWQTVAFVTFINLHLRQNGHPATPSLDQVKGEVQAVVNQGRWLVECPTPECGGALVISRAVPLFMCPYCANESNGGQWLTIKFPANKAAIEAELLKRPARDPFRASHRNWRPGETLAQLRAENKRMGIV